MRPSGHTSRCVGVRLIAIGAVALGSAVLGIALVQLLAAVILWRLLAQLVP